MKTILRKIMKGLVYLFSDNNSINEKSVVGFLAFAMMIFVLMLDMVTGLLNKEFPIHEFIYDGFLYIAIGALGIASVDKIFRKTMPTDTNFEQDIPTDTMDDSECGCKKRNNCNE